MRTTVTTPRPKLTFARRLLPLLLLFILPAAVQAQFRYTTDNGAVTITGNDCSIGGGAVTIPSTINGLPVTSIGAYAFEGCTSLTGVYFQGNPPSISLIESLFFLGDDSSIVYYLPGTTGWSSTFAGRPAVLWNPQVQTGDASFGVRAGQFGFIITWASDKVIVVEACADLSHPVWSAVGTNTLTAGSSYFSDLDWAKYPSRVYRLRAP